MAEDMKDLGKYDPSQIEQKWYNFWEEHGVFHDEADPEKEPYSIVLPPQHPLLERDSISLADVASQPLIQLNADEMGLHTQRIWSRAGLSPQVSLRTASVEAVRSLVAAGLGLSIQPDMTYRPWSLEGDIIEARPLADLSATLDVGLAWRRGAARPALVDPFLSIAREQPHSRKISI